MSEILILSFCLCYGWLFENWSWGLGHDVWVLGWFAWILFQQQDERNSSPVQLSKFLGRDKEDGVRRSAVSGKKILLKLEKSKEDKAAENKRNELLKFLNASCD